jgi:hypothetical protein
VLLIIANVGTAVVIFRIARRQSEILARGYVIARVVEATFIAIGMVCLLAVATLRYDGGTSLMTGAKSLVAVRNWTFVLGPGFFAGFGNGLIIRYLMYRSGLMPRGLVVLGLIGGTLICIAGLEVALNVFHRGGTAQVIAAVPEFIWVLSLGIYLIVKGFRASPILEPSLALT